MPGSTIGILGGGQLGRMMAMAARSLGYRIQVMDPDPLCPARSVVDSCIEGSWADSHAAAALAQGCDVVTLEIEQISQESLAAAQQFAPVRPGPALMGTVQNRIDQKQWLTRHGFPLGPFAAVYSFDDLIEAAKKIGPHLYLKSASGGYDGRSQVKIQSSSLRELEAAWHSLGSRPCVAEQALTLESEISVMVARSPDGALRTYPSARNHHKNQILVWSVIPSSIPPQLEAAAQSIASRIAELSGLEGILAVEMFLTDTGQLLVNELAPRPHNSYHASAYACATDQFEQSVRAICGLPLGEVEVIQPAAIANLLGDLWLEREPRFDLALAVPGVHLHLYEKREARKGRKMGHLAATGTSPEQAVKRVLRAHKALSA